MFNSRTFFALLLFIFAVGCTPVTTQTVDSELQVADATATDEVLLPTATETPLPMATLVPATEEPSATPAPSVRVTAVNGNLYIRRGPSTAYDRIAVLKSATSATVIGQDMLSKWVQVQIPNSEQTGWVSLLTPYSRIDGDLQGVPAFTFTEWPEPAYIKNCTEHNVIILPNELYLYSLWTNANYLNYVQVDPGTYQIQDATLPDAPVYDMIDVREGETFYITVNGSGDYHKCPENN